MGLAEQRRIPFDKATVKAARSKWKVELARLKRWSSFRNQVAGHYGKDLRAQVMLLKELDPTQVMSVTKAFLGFNMAVLVGLRDAGKGVVTPNPTLERTATSGARSTLRRASLVVAP